MNHDRIIRATARLALYTTIVLIYWVGIFMVVTVFDLKVFKQRTTAAFGWSILGILTVLGASIILNTIAISRKSPPFCRPATTQRSRPRPCAGAARAPPLRCWSSC
jgi:hypothetical protein